MVSWTEMFYVVTTHGVHNEATNRYLANCILVAVEEHAMNA